MAHHGPIPPPVIGTIVFNPIAPAWVIPGYETAQRLQPGDQVIGTCSKCCGPVCIPHMWVGVVPPVPTCRKCGSRKKGSHGPLIEME